ncbi:hypothetical protein Poli38472_009442 [Pythium oligandrum]|uniref:Mediator of RNA polymerase II transcription subunit 13 n=1 Tax=Pythium oligandrum TaxID=41045 RepID=A0A8K1FID0_PYTOL|nr:hypothetical protein Poli38472_009442 [Pythium oligandrum]|eukprot:TMW61949.1 hypothetical protein Poli38472_009442 [Pythium oligandrum]
MRQRSATDTPSVPARAAVDTNVFELGEIKLLQWRTYAVRQADGKLSQRSDAGMSGEWTESEQIVTSPEGVDAFGGLAQFIKQQNALYAWEKSVSSEEPFYRLWVFSVNESQRLPADDTVSHDTLDVESGEWTVSSQEQLAPRIQSHLFRALNLFTTKQLVIRGEFHLERECFVPNDAKFVYHCPSLTKINHFDIYLNEEFPTPAFQIHFQLLQPSVLLCMNVEMMSFDLGDQVDSELGDAVSSWQRLMGLPGTNDHSMVDVWHLDEGLAPRIVSETKHADVYPRFRAMARRSKRRKGEDGEDAGDGDESGKNTDDNDDEGDDDDDGANDGDDSAPRRSTSSKKKRKKPAADVAENDESITPISPDTHINTPEASGPIVRITFPHGRDSSLHSDPDVHHYKRRRRRTKHSQDTLSQHSRLSLTFTSNSASESYSKLPQPSSSTPKELLRRLSGSVRHVETNGFTSDAQSSGSKKTDAKPALSLAVSLVASLTQDEKQEALDTKPVKTHPLLEAMSAYVEKEMLPARSVPSGNDFVRAVPNDPSLSPTLTNKSISRGSGSVEQFRSAFQSDRFKKWIIAYYPRDYRRSKRYQRREHERRLLLDFDQDKLEQYNQTLAFKTAHMESRWRIRDDEIRLGVHLAALDALTPWRHTSGDSTTRWKAFYANAKRPLDNQDSSMLRRRLLPYFQLVQGSIKGKIDEAVVGDDDEVGEIREPWMGLEDYVIKRLRWQDQGGSAGTARTIGSEPLLCASTVDSVIDVDASMISEFQLRGFNPVPGPKPVDYVIVCPQTPSEWLGTLTLSYLTSFRSTYTQCAMGDQVPVDISRVQGTVDVSVDTTSGVLLVGCAMSSDDAFAPYRQAGELLRPVISQGVKRTQAFARSAVANVVYLVAPFRRSDMKHKTWLLGAFARGLFGEDTANSFDWLQSITVELLYLEDLYEVVVDTNPYALVPAAFALYNRVSEQVNLKPIDRPAGDDHAPEAPATGKSRYLSERVYHLAEKKSDESSENAVAAPSSRIHVGYAVSGDKRWVVSSYADAVGSVLETKMIELHDSDLKNALLRMVTYGLEFAALFGASATLVVTRFGNTNETVVDDEMLAWQRLQEDAVYHETRGRYTSLVPRILVAHASFLSQDQVQVGAVAETTVIHREQDGVLVMPRDDSASRRERSRVSGAAWLNATDTAVHTGTVLIRMQILETMSAANTPASTAPDDLDAILSEFWELSFLTMHPVTLSRHSPLPLHLAAVDTMKSELSQLEMQLTTDPWTLRR